MSTKYAKMSETSPLLDDNDVIITVDMWVEILVSALSKLKSKIDMTSPKGKFKYVWKAAFFRAYNRKTGVWSRFRLVYDQYPSIPSNVVSFEHWASELSEKEIVIPSGFYKGKRLVLETIVQKFGRNDSKECHKYYLAIKE